MKKIFFTFSVLLFLIFNANSQEQKLTLYKNNVIASYYGADFHGKQTSNGEKFNMNDYTCAHKELPFGTILKVTNLKNSLSVNVRVNDRGPFVQGREIDLSKAAAIALKMTGDGTAKVKLEIIKKPEHTKQSLITAQKAMAKMNEIQGTPANYEEDKLWDIQLGSFSSRENANVLAQKLLKAGFTNVVFQKTKDKIRVAIRQVPTEKLAQTEKQLKEKGFTNYLIKERK